MGLLVSPQRQRTLLAKAVAALGIVLSLGALLVGALGIWSFGWRSGLAWSPPSSDSCIWHSLGIESGRGRIYLSHLQIRATYPPSPSAGLRRWLSHSPPSLGSELRRTWQHRIGMGTFSLHWGHKNEDVQAGATVEARSTTESGVVVSHWWIMLCLVVWAIYCLWWASDRARYGPAAFDVPTHPRRWLARAIATAMLALSWLIEMNLAINVPIDPVDRSRGRIYQAFGVEFSPGWWDAISFIAVLVAVGSVLVILGHPIYCRALASRMYRRYERGLCTMCGYDLRGIADRCPECGTRKGTRTDAPGAVNGSGPDRTE